MIFLAYSENAKGYRLMDLATKKIIMTSLANTQLQVTVGVQFERVIN